MGTDNLVCGDGRDRGAMVRDECVRSGYCSPVVGIFGV